MRSEYAAKRRILLSTQDVSDFWLNLRFPLFPAVFPDIVRPSSGIKNVMRWLCPKICQKISLPLQVKKNHGTKGTYEEEIRRYGG